MIENPFLILSKKLDRIENLLVEKSQPANDNIPEQWLNIQQLCEYLPDRPAKATIYGWVHQAFVPYHKRGKKLYFLKSEIDKWLLDGKVL